MYICAYIYLSIYIHIQVDQNVIHLYAVINHTPSVCVCVRACVHKCIYVYMYTDI